MDLIELRLAIRRNWVFGLVAIVLVAVGGLLTLPPREAQHEATATMAVSPRAERLDSTAVLRVLLPNVLALVESDRLLEAAAEITHDDPTGVGVAAAFEEGTGVLVVRTRADGSATAVAWSRAVERAVLDAYEDDPYLLVASIDPASTASRAGVLSQQIDRVAVLLLALMAGLLTVFTAQRIRESGDIAGRLRSGGIPVVAELPIASSRRGRDGRTTEYDERRLALTLSSGPGIEPGTRFVVVGESVGSTIAVVDAVRSGLAAVGRDEQHRVALGPAMRDLRGLQQAANGSGVCIAVLDQRERVDRFMAGVRALGDAHVPLAGVVVVRKA